MNECCASALSVEYSMEYVHVDVDVDMDAKMKRRIIL